MFDRVSYDNNARQSDGGLKACAPPRPGISRYKIAGRNKVAPAMDGPEYAVAEGNIVGEASAELMKVHGAAVDK